MITVCGIQTEDFKKVSVEEVLDYFKERKEVQFDAETSSLSCLSGHILCFQLGDYENQFVIAGDKIQEFKEFLEEKTLIGQNIKFDLGFLYKQNIYPIKVFDTFLAESVISCGIKSIRRNLAAIASRRLGVDLDKSIREEIPNEGLTKRVIQYAAEDVKYLEKIRESQMSDIKYHDLAHALEVENQFVLVLAYIEVCGMKLDRDKWLKKMEGDYVDFETAKKVLDDYLIENHSEYINTQLDLFSSDVKTTINWSSSRQVVELFKKIKIPVSFIIRGEEKESVEAKNIAKFAPQFKIVKLYLKYKEYEKEVSTYGKNFIDQINPKTGRLHTNFKQIMDTGRLSSGGSDKKNKLKFINFQNIPADKETRACFTAEEGNKLTEADYVGQEAIVFANQCLDKKLLEFYDGGMADMHSFVASKMWPELENKTVGEIKEFYADKRQAAKTAGFSILYGGVGATIARNNNISVQEGDAIYESYFNAFPGLKSYFEEEKKKGLTFGYIQFNDTIKTKSFIENYDEFLRLKQEINSGFWDRWKIIKPAFLEHGKAEEEYKEMRTKISKFFKIKGGIERKALNYKIQGTSATITKIASIYFFKWIRENNFINKVWIVNEVHDSILVESPEGITKQAVKALREAMIRAGAIFCKRVPLKVETHTGDFWKK